MKIGYQSLRKISKYFQVFLGIQISHQTIRNWSNQNHEDTIHNEEFEYSGYYLYDEQFLRLNGVIHYRLKLYDANSMFQSQKELYVAEYRKTRKNLF